MSWEALFVVAGAYALYKYFNSDKEKLDAKVAEHSKSQIDFYKSEIEKLYSLLESSFTGKSYITQKKSNQLNKKLIVVEENQFLSQKNCFPDEETNRLLEIIKVSLNNLDEDVLENNLEYANSLSQTYPDVFIDRKNKLTQQQILSTVAEEPNILLVAGAGSGKTSSIVGRVKYLRKVKKVNPENILVITFSEDTKNELTERLIAEKEIEIRTFHSLGLKFLKMYGDYSNSNDSIVSNLATSKIKFKKFLDLQIDSMFADEKYREKLTKHFISYLKPYKSVFDESFSSIKDYVRYMKDNGVMRTLQGHSVRSFEEFEIANFLYLNGINYIYEMPYKGHVPVPQDGRRRRQYKPDFYLVDYDIYIEHFAIDKDGNPPPHWYEVDYVAQMNWKRQLHKDNNTKLIETYSYERMQNRLIEGLSQKLAAESINFKLMDKEELLRVFNEAHMINRFTTIMITFLNHFKSNELSLPLLKTKAGLKVIYESSRELSFLKIFEFILDAYNRELATTNPPKIDFVDMIVKTKKYLSSDKNLVLNYEHIIVDEFQDISAATFDFLKTVRDKSPKSHLYAVGDDWQSIYQFLGSDVSLFTDFEENITKKENEVIRINLSDTFRFHQNLADISSEFIMKNKNQLTKEIQSNNPILKDSVEIIYSSKEDILDNVVEAILKEEPKSSIMIIGRYRNNKLVTHLSNEYKNNNLSYKTVHKSKGLEADYVIIYNVKSGLMGFPSEIVDDPLLNLVTRKSPFEAISFPEERRLFYVALTRAKKKVKIIADDKFKSMFVAELEKNPLVIISRDELKPALINCPSCEEGEMQIRQNQIDSNYFFGCSNYPVCSRTLNFNPDLHDEYLQYHLKNSMSKKTDT